MDWVPDILPGFVAAPLGGATVIRPDAPLTPARAAVLHVHGYNDYFYQDDLAEEFEKADLAFYAVDLHRAGRSLRPGDHPHDMADVAEQGEDMTAACDVIAAEFPGLPIIVHAHSTGALAAVIWAKDHPHPQLAGLILNSPLFGLPMSRRDSVALKALPAVKRIHPGFIVGRRPAIYAKHLHVSGGGPAEFNMAWKRPAGVPTTARWVSAVTRAWDRVDAGLGLTLPILVAHSDSTGPERDDNPRIAEQDVVVDVDAIAVRAPRLGSDVEDLVVVHGIHDLSQSAPVPRAEYYDGVNAWLDRVLA